MGDKKRGLQGTNLVNSVPQTKYLLNSAGVLKDEPESGMYAGVRSHRIVQHKSLQRKGAVGGGGARNGVLSKHFREEDEIFGGMNDDYVGVQSRDSYGIPTAGKHSRS